MGCVLRQLSPMESDTLPLIKIDPYNLINIDEENFSYTLFIIGYRYKPPFRGLSNICLKLGYSVGTLTNQSGPSLDDTLILHPSTLKCACRLYLLLGQSQVTP